MGGDCRYRDALSHREHGIQYVPHPCGPRYQYSRAPSDCIFLYVNASAKSSSTLGATNGIAQTAASLARAIGPAGATSLFAFSNQHPDIANGALVYWVLIGITIVAIGVARLLPEKPWERDLEWERNSSVKGV